MSSAYDKLDQPSVLHVLFHPRVDGSDAPDGAEDLTIPVAAGLTLGGRYFPAPAPADPTILFFHGNGEVAAEYDDFGQTFNAMGIGFLVVDYRGYGRSGGTPSVSTMLADGRLVLEWTKEKLKAEHRSGPLLVMGRSLGSAVAIELAGLKDPAMAALIIESGFADTMPLLANLGLDPASAGLTEADGFGNIDKIEVWDRPLYILHAQFDEIIPVSQAETLHSYCQARNRELAVVPGAGHNTIIEKVGRMYFEAIARFIASINRPQRRKKMGVRG